MMHISTKTASFLKIGAVLFCFMCLFFATYMASRYEHAKTETEIQAHKVKELEEKYQELSMIHQKLLQTRTVLIQEKEQMVQEINMLQGKNIGPEDWIHTREKKTPDSEASTNQQPITDGKTLIFDVKENLAMDQLPPPVFTDQTQPEVNSAGTQTGNAVPAQISK